MFGKIGDIAGLLRHAPELMRQAQEMQSRAAEIQERLGALEVEGSAGGGLVTVTATGQQKIAGVQIDPSLLNDREMLEDLLVAAVNQALEKAKALATEEMSKLTGDMNIPGMEDVMSKFGFGPGNNEP